MTRPTPGVVFVVGVGADGWDGLPRASQTAIGSAQVLLGGPRQLALVPEIPGQERRQWPSPLLRALPGVMNELGGRSVTVLASGDPFLSGIGSTLVNLLGAGHVRVLPAVSSVALASARMGWSAESFDVITVVGRNPAAILRSLSPGRRLIVLSADETTPALVADMLTGAGYGPSGMTVLCDLGSFKEARLDATASAFPATAIPRLNLVCVQCVPKPSTVLLPTIGGLPDDAFEHDGQLTKRDARASALARSSGTSAPVPDRWPSSGPGPIPGAGRSLSRRIPLAPRGSPGTPAGSVCQACRCSPGQRPRVWPASRCRTRSSSAAAPASPACWRTAGRP
jgi:precorrin-6Y C5,15-methyltransferase (decarboxylating)